MPGAFCAPHPRVSARARNDCWPLIFVSCAIVEFVSVGFPCVLWTGHEASVFHATFGVLWLDHPPQRSSRSQSTPTNGGNRLTQRPHVRNVRRCPWLSKGRAKTKQATSRPRA